MAHEAVPEADGADEAFRSRQRARVVRAALAQLRPSDRVFEAFGVKVVVDPKSLVYLGGMQLDFVRGMMGHGFKFNNPNVKGSCGCGESVQF